MPEVIYTTHVWMGAGYLPLDDRLAKRAAKRGTCRLPRDTKVDMAEVICWNCRGNYSDVAGEPCKITPWLRGGPIGERKKRKGRVDPAGNAPPDADEDTAITAAGG